MAVRKSITTSRMQMLTIRTLEKVFRKSKSPNRRYMKKRPQHPSKLKRLQQHPNRRSMKKRPQHPLKLKSESLINPAKLHFLSDFD